MNKDPIDRMLDASDGMIGGPKSKMPGADFDPDIARGKRMREYAGHVGSAPPTEEKQTFGEAVGVLFAMALAVVGLFVGGTQWGLFGALGLGAINGFRRLGDGRNEMRGTFGVVVIDAERPLVRLKEP